MVKMDTEKRLNAYLQELAAQRGLLGDRALDLAAMLAEARERIAELEKEAAELKGHEPLREVK